MHQKLIKSTGQVWGGAVGEMVFGWLWASPSGGRSSDIRRSGSRAGGGRPSSKHLKAYAHGICGCARSRSDGPVG